MIWPLFWREIVHILVKTMTPKGHSEINWPLAFPASPLATALKLSREKGLEACASLLMLKITKHKLKFKAAITLCIFCKELVLHTKNVNIRISNNKIVFLFYCSQKLLRWNSIWQYFRPGRFSFLLKAGLELLRIIKYFFELKICK